MTLIATFEIIRKRHITDDILRHQLGQTKFGQAFEGTHAIDHCLSNVIKGLSPPRTAVKYARYLRVVKEIQINCNRIINSDTVTLLLPLTVAVPTPKSAHRTLLLVWAHIMQSHRCHSPFMPLVGAINIKITQTNNGRT